VLYLEKSLDVDEAKEKKTLNRWDDWLRILHVARKILCVAMVPDVAAEEHVGVQPTEERDLRVRRRSSESGACMESVCV
jgi:hypothetical protein